MDWSQWMFRQLQSGHYHLALTKCSLAIPNCQLAMPNCQQAMPSYLYRMTALCYLLKQHCLLLLKCLLKWLLKSHLQRVSYVFLYRFKTIFLSTTFSSTINYLYPLPSVTSSSTFNYLYPFPSVTETKIRNCSLSFYDILMQDILLYIMYDVFRSVLTSL